MPTPYTVICADRKTGEDYPIVISADSPQAAMQKAAAAGHVVGRIETGRIETGRLAHNPAGHADADPTPESEQLATLLREARGIRTELMTMLPLLSDCAAFGRRQKHLTISVAVGVVIGLVLWTGLAWLLAGVALAQYAATHPR